MAAGLEIEDVRVPNGIEQRVVEILKKRPGRRWDAAIKEVLADGNNDDEE